MNLFMETVRIGCVPFLNAVPLISYFSTSHGMNEAELQLGVPTELARWIESDFTAASLASSFYAFSQENMRVADAISISSRGPIESVRLFSKKSFEEIETLSLDATSMTSNQLAQIILAERFGIRPKTFLAPPNLKAMLERTDAAVLIGDIGLAAEHRGLHVMDLGSAWEEMTRLPFVWALWIGKEKLDEKVAGMLLRAKRYGIERLVPIAKEEAEKRNLPLSMCLRYLIEIVDYEFEDSHKRGLELFGELCVKHKLSHENHSPTFVRAAQDMPSDAKPTKGHFV
ncbi:MAG TPA: menaquinone biosynthesis protein [Fimbriimonadales bacterium]|nr:menaquinone biosynthesis protein [Fimbriimonadales bacterium]